MELLWITSNWSRVHYGALVAGHKADGGPLYVAQVYEDVYDIWLAGNYDPGKRCAEYLIFRGGRNCTISCGEIWKLLVVKYGMPKITYHKACLETLRQGFSLRYVHEKMQSGLLLSYVTSVYTVTILGIGSANERRRYKVVSFHTGQVHTQNYLCIYKLWSMKSSTHNWQIQLIWM